MEKVRDLRTMKEVFDYVNEIYPGWIIDILDDYPDEYECLRRSWEIVLQEKGIPRQKILILSSINTDDQDQLGFAELFSSVGFLVRTTDEIKVCTEPGCSRAIITENRFNYLRTKNTNLPATWLSKCQLH